MSEYEAWRQEGFLLFSLVLLTGVFVTFAVVEWRTETEKLKYERSAEGVNAMLTEFFRTNEVALRDNTAKGSLLRVTGTGYATPGPWNLEGQFYLSMQRLALFERGQEQPQIVVFGGEERSVFRSHAKDSLVLQRGSSLVYVTSPRLRHN